MSFAPLSEGGEYRHKLTIDEMPSHNHYFPDGSNASDAPLWNIVPNIEKSHLYDKKQWYTHTNYSGKDQKHNIIQPYIAIHFWKRVS